MFSHLARTGLNARLQLETLAEASLEVLRAAEALEAASHHDGDTLAEGFALLHAANTGTRIHGTTQHTSRTPEPIEKPKLGRGTETD